MIHNQRVDVTKMLCNAIESDPPLKAEIQQLVSDFGATDYASRIVKGSFSKNAEVGIDTPPAITNFFSAVWNSIDWTRIVDHFSCHEY